MIIRLVANLVAVVLCAVLPVWAASGQDAGDVELEASILRARPAVVLISSEVSAEASIDCGTGPARAVHPDPHIETGSGFVIHPDGYLATNGHVVAAFYEKMSDRALVDELVRAAAEKACGPALAGLPDGLRRERLTAIAAEPHNRRNVRLSKELLVHFSNGQTYPAQVLVYSPALNPAATAREAAGRDLGPMERSGKDVAILKVAASDLPTVRLAANSRGLLIGQPVFVIGFPGVVLYHDFLSKQQSTLDASVTVGRISGFKTDITGRRVIQTDAAITWGHSGGPAFTRQGEVIGAATFISTSLEGDQAIQGFNFLIPVETVQEFAGRIGLTPTADSPLMQQWGRAVASFFAGEYGRTIQAVEAAERIRPGFADVVRLGVEARSRMQSASGPGGFQRRLGVGLFGSLGLVLLLIGIRHAIRVRLQRLRGTVARIDPSDVRSRLERGSSLTLVDARKAEDLVTSPVQAAGALRYDATLPASETFKVQVAADGEVIAYCT